MSAETQAVFRGALALAPQDRENLAVELLASLEPEDDPEAVRTLWAQELERRARRALSGESPGEDWAVVRQRIADELSG